jgi:DNA-binding CsgD family transcriptional regulator
MTQVSRPRSRRCRDDVLRGLAADLRQLADDLDAAAHRRRPPPILTPREHEILRRVATGQTNAEIAAELFLAGNTVKTYWQNALQKLGVRNRAQAIHRAHELRLL